MSHIYSTNSSMGRFIWELNWRMIWASYQQLSASWCIDRNPVSNRSSVGSSICLWYSRAQFCNTKFCTIRVYFCHWMTATVLFFSQMCSDCQHDVVICCSDKATFFLKAKSIQSPKQVVRKQRTLKQVWIFSTLKWAILKCYSWCLLLSGFPAYFIQKTFNQTFLSNVLFTFSSDLNIKVSLCPEWKENSF